MNEYNIYISITMSDGHFSLQNNQHQPPLKYTLFSSKTMPPTIGLTV